MGEKACNHIVITRVYFTHTQREEDDTGRSRMTRLFILRRLLVFALFFVRYCNGLTFQAVLHLVGRGWLVTYRRLRCVWGWVVVNPFDTLYRAKMYVAVKFSFV